MNEVRGSGFDKTVYTSRRVRKFRICKGGSSFSNMKHYLNFILRLNLINHFLNNLTPRTLNSRIVQFCLRICPILTATGYLRSKWSIRLDLFSVTVLFIVKQYSLANPFTHCLSTKEARIAVSLLGDKTRALSETPLYFDLRNPIRYGI